MVEDEATEDHKIGGPGPNRGTSARLDATDVMSWGIKLEIVHISEIG